MVFANANFPTSADGRTYHVELKRGEAANRIITVGDPARAKRLAKFLDSTPPVFELNSHRGFYTATGRYKGVPVSIIAIGMGIPMMDFFVREVRAVVDGPLCIIRLGSCGSLNGAKPGEFMVPTSAVALTRNYNYFAPGAKGQKPYDITMEFPADPTLSKIVTEELSQVFGNDKVHNGVNITADSFYSSQGRMDDNFKDDNQDLFEVIHKELPSAVSLEMETFMLYHLAHCTTAAPLVEKKHQQSIHCGASMMVFADRVTNQFIDHSIVPELEEKAGRAVFEALIKWTPDETVHDEHGSVWEKLH
ncbi:purine and uridine phosphorylase [Basidiobolus meristosporus CBS 931.73]|uniref:Purine and uridine phosphorylase n=1 Tax=Basidiobolus meristosporus CBS 931.73 TaxID=1314790 RepID=A0A1Y1Y1S9_9FUNG|nr:purine and uridine phosphorylase [Basidiobolus meristosporus CBS 931.73]|eukprot:ORX91971.1 purine and uridine phosphorylase [Basidiobolus meristosporus CBS 931.73]